MTVIAGAIDRDGTVFIGADKLCGALGGVLALTSSKVRHNGDYLIGGAGSARTVQIAHYIFKPPKPKGDVFVFMVTKFAASLRACMKKHGGETWEEEVELMDGRLLVGYGGRLFEIDRRYAVHESAVPYHAIGCASQAARSAMHARRGSRAKSMVEAGLDAAAAFDINIRPPFTIESIKKNG